MKRTVLALGFFDGLHIGHGALLQRARSVADQLGCEAKVLTFDTHPDELVFGQRVPLINTAEDRLEMARRIFHMDGVISCHFDRALMQMPWQKFIDTVLLQQEHAAHVVCGESFRFGYRGEGTPQALQARCKELGIGCDICPNVTLDGTVVSSTEIRKLLQSGEMAQANRFLGHPYQLTGTVVAGQQLGRTIGIPTANLHLPPELLVVRNGVYVTLAEVEGSTYPAVTNVGVRPTVGGQQVTVEPWLLDFSGDLYGKTLCLRFYDFLRPEKKFDSLERLQAEIFRNAAQTRAYFQENASLLRKK